MGTCLILPSASLSAFYVIIHTRAYCIENRFRIVVTKILGDSIRITRATILMLLNGRNFFT